MSLALAEVLPFLYFPNYTCSFERLKKRLVFGHLTIKLYLIINFITPPLPCYNPSNSSSQNRKLKARNIYEGRYSMSNFDKLLKVYAILLQQLFL